MNPIYKILLNTFMSFVALFVIAKINGKKQIAQLEFIDYIIGISIGSIAAAMTTEVDTPFYYFLIAMAVFMLLDLAITLLSRKAVWLKKLLNGKPLILIEEGKINYKNLKSSKLDVNELLALCRTQGYFDLKDVYYCIYEINGEVSILPSAAAAPVVIQDIKTEFKTPSLSADFVIDGKIIEKAMRAENKTKDWLLEKLNIKTDKELKNIILATFDEANDSLIVHTKNQAG